MSSTKTSALTQGDVLDAEQDPRSPLAQARGWTLEQDRKLERGLIRLELQARLEAQRIIEGRREPPPTAAHTQAVRVRPREHRSRRSQRSAARGDPSPSEPAEPPLQVVPVSRFRRDVRRWLEGVSGLYVVTTVPCPSCGGDLPLRLSVGFIEALERQGISEAEQFEAVVKGLASHRIVCSHCQRARQN